jgi:hypothetical protein
MHTKSRSFDPTIPTSRTGTYIHLIKVEPENLLCRYLRQHLIDKIVERLIAGDISIYERNFHAYKDSTFLKNST